jgi:hypothetical protein
VGDDWENGELSELLEIAELLIDCEEDRSLRAVPIGMLRETDWGH